MHEIESDHYFHYLSRDTSTARIMKTQITDLFGLKIYSENGMYVGEIEDILLDIDSKRIESLAVGNLTSGIGELGSHRGVKIPFRLVKSVSDVVVIRHIPQLFHGADELH